MLLWCDSAEYLKQFKTLYFDEKGDNPVNLISVRPYKNTVILKLEGCDTMEKAESLKNKILYGSRDDAVISEGANYIADLIGCDVIDAKTKESYGTVFDVVNYGSCDIYDLRNNGKQFLIPATKEIVKKIDIENGVIEINKMKGLFNED